MNKTVIILIDDVHLEGRPIEMQQDFFKTIAEKIKTIKNNNCYPVLVAAGDIGEGVMGVEWLKDFDCDVVYVAGNHEYWSHDVMEVDQKIEQYIVDNGLVHVHFLNDKTKIINGVRFIGGTLWTSLGSFFPWLNRNQIIKFFGAMGDFKNIVANDWYTEDNIKKLDSYLVSHGVDSGRLADLIENKRFNPLIELERHYETLDFFNKELHQVFNGETVVVSHHMPSYESWMKKFNVDTIYTKGEWVNNEKYLLDSAKGNVSTNKDIVMLSFYANDLKDWMFGEFAPSYWLHGHLHLAVDDIIGKTKIISSPAGYFKQNKEIKLKEITVGQDKQFVATIVRKEIESFDWANNFLSNLRILEKTINKFEISIGMGIMVAMDFESFMQSAQKIHEFNMDELNKNLLNWLSILYYQSYDDHKKNLDLFYVKKKLNYSDIMIKFPELIKGTVNQYSFLPEEKFKIANRVDIKNSHFKDWIKDIQKIQIQIIQFKKSLLDFIDNYEKS